MARPTLLTQPSGVGNLTMGDIVVRNIGRGLSHREAARASGINVGTLTSWLYRGRTALARIEAGDQTVTVAEARFAEFAARVEDATAQARARLMEQVEGAAFEPQVVKRVTRKLVDSGRVDAEGKPILVEVERTEKVEEHPPRWAAAAWLMERRWPNEYGNRVQVTAGAEVDRDRDERAFADELRAFLEGAAAAGELAAGPIDVEPVEDVAPD